MIRIGVIGAVIDHPNEASFLFNQTVSEFKDIVIGRMGIPITEHDISVVSITVKGDLDRINFFTGKLGRIKGVNVKTSISKKEIL
jgi:putative iron-only hydrogenase system regulator